MKDIEREVLKTFREADPERRVPELSVIRWICDGKGSAPQLCNQEFYIDRFDKKRKQGKLKGLKWGDWKFLTEKPERIEEITELLLDLPTRARRPPERLPYADTPDENVDWSKR